MASAAESNLKYRAILNSMPSLIDLIDKGDPMKLALRLFQEGLLKEYTYDELLLECKTGTDKARKIVFEIHSQAEVNPVETYEKLIEVLNKEEMFNAVKLIEERYKMALTPELSESAPSGVIIVGKLAHKRNRDGTRKVADSSAEEQSSKSGSIEDAKKIAGFIGEEKKIKRKTAHIMVIGFPGNGKSRLLDNLLQQDTRDNYSSTDISDSVVVVDVTGKDTTSHNTLIGRGSSWNKISSFEDSMRMQLQQCDELIPDKKHLPQPEEETPPDEIPQHSSATKSMPTAILQENISRVLEQNKMCYEDLESTFSLYIRDTGGQVEFQEVLSILINGPSIFFFVIKANLSLDQPLELKYRRKDGELINCYESTTTTRQALVQTLTTIQSTADPKGVKTHESAVFIIGTHIDKIEPPESKEEKISELNAELHSLIKDKFDDIVEYNKSNNVLFPVSNTHSKREAFEHIQKRVNEKIEDSGCFEVEYPLGYLLFSLELRRCKDDVLYRTECVEIAEKFEIKGNEEVDKMLTFLHHRIGIIQYYNTDDLKHLVIKEPQVLFSKLTELMVKTFPSSNVLMPGAKKDLTKKGIINATTLKELFTKVSAMESKDFVSFLEHLRIAASFYDEEGEKYLFIPSVVNHLPEKKSSKEAYSPKVCPLVITFESSCCPKGVFGMTVCHFMSNKKKENQVIFSLDKKSIYRDLVCFDMNLSAEPKGKVFLSIQTSKEQLPSQTSLKPHPPCSFPSTHIEVRLGPDRGEHFKELATLCNQIRITLMEGICHSMSRLNYKESRVGAVESLSCHSCERIHKKCTTNGKASVYCNERVILEECCSCWFSEAIEKPDSTRVVEDSRTSNQQVPTTNTATASCSPEGQFQRTAKREYSDGDGVTKSSSKRRCQTSSTLTDKDLPEVHEAIFDANKEWYEIGMLLKVDVTTLDSIEDEQKGNSKKLLRMLKHWLQVGTNRSWEALDKALRNKTVARPDVADKLPK